VALLWKMICNLGDPMSRRHPVFKAEACAAEACEAEACGAEACGAEACGAEACEAEASAKTCQVEAS